MSTLNDRDITNDERAEIAKRKLEVKLQKKTKQASSLTDLKKELGLDKGKRR